MADASKPEVDFSADGVRNFIIKQGGKVSNVAVVGHFMSFLRHPDKEVREENRIKFKEFMNEVAVVKKDEKDDKIVVLKRKKEKEKINYGDFVELPRLVVFQDKDPLQPSTDSSEPLPVPPVRRSKQAKRSSSEEEVQPAAMVMGPSTEGKIPEYTGPKEQQDVISSKEGERIIDQKRQIQSVRSFADIFDQEVQSQKEEAERLRSPAKMAKKNAEQVASTEPEAETNRQEDILKEDEPAPLISLDPLEHQWMMESAKANLAALSNLLKQDIKLAGKKDFITGFTAVHWGAKHGKKEMIRLVADRGADVNSKSQGGYTPLHIAAMHNKESIMQFLIQDYHADVNIRDYSGRKARHYLKTGASSYMQRKRDPFSCYPSTPSISPSFSTSSISAPRNGLAHSRSAHNNPDTGAQPAPEDNPGSSFTRAMERLSFKRPAAVRRSKSERHPTPAAKSTPSGGRGLRHSPSLKRRNSKHATEIYLVD